MMIWECGESAKHGSLSHRHKYYSKARTERYRWRQPGPCVVLIRTARSQVAREHQEAKVSMNSTVSSTPTALSLQEQEAPHWKYSAQHSREKAGPQIEGWAPHGNASQQGGPSHLDLLESLRLAFPSTSEPAAEEKVAPGGGRCVHPRQSTGWFISSFLFVCLFVCMLVFQLFTCFILAFILASLNRFYNSLSFCPILYFLFQLSGL